MHFLYFLKISLIFTDSTIYTEVIPLLGSLQFKTWGVFRSILRILKFTFWSICFLVFFKFNQDNHVPLSCWKGIYFVDDYKWSLFSFFRIHLLGTSLLSASAKFFHYIPKFSYSDWEEYTNICFPGVWIMQLLGV